jgi:hypothetical protein
MEAMFQEFFNWCERNNVPVVLAAGNMPSARPLHEGLPQKFGTETNSIITVGGIREDGKLWPGTAPHDPGTEGSMTLYAPAENIEIPGPRGIMITNPGQTAGTSQAAAIVVCWQILLQDEC